MVECFNQSNNNPEIASENYLLRYPERRQPHKSIFNRLKKNLINYGSFKKARSETYTIEHKEETINVLGMVAANPSTSSRKIEEECGTSRRRALNILKTHKFKPYVIRKRHHL